MKTPIPPELATEVIAASLAEISAAITRIRSGRLNEKALLLLISHASGVPQREVRAVLDGIEGMRTYYLKKELKP